MRVVLAAVLLVLAPAALRGQQQPARQQQPAQPAAPATTPRGEPATPPVPVSSVRTFTTPAGMIINAVRAERVADFEKVIGYLQEALASSASATVRAQAEGWRVLKVSEPGPNGAVLYVFLFDPTVPGADYGLGRILAEAVTDQTKLQEIWKLYTDSLASGGSLLSLTPVQVGGPEGPPLQDKPEGPPLQGKPETGKPETGK
jgi:hypothetical protein